MKQQKILMIFTPIICVILAIISYFGIKNSEFSDSLKFKKEYESLNGKASYGENKYKDLSISKINPIKYSNYDEIIDIINNGTGIIYLGFPECPWCRTAVPVLLDVAKDNEVNTIYYLNIKNERDSYIIEDGELTLALNDDGKEIKGTKGYFRLLDALKDNLSDYIISYEDKTYEVGEKRIYAPSVIFVKDGKVLGIQVSTVEDQTDPFKELTEEQYEELYSIYEGYVNNIYSSTCDINSSC